MNNSLTTEAVNAFDDGINRSGQFTFHIVIMSVAFILSFLCIFSSFGAAMFFLVMCAAHYFCALGVLVRETEAWEEMVAVYDGDVNAQ